MKKIVCFLLTVMLMVSLVPIPASAMSASAYVLYDPVSKRVVEGSNIHTRMTMASTTKIMSGLIVCESGKLNDEVKITDQMVRVEGTSAGLRAGDIVPLKTLLYGMMLESGNDATNSAAIFLGSSLKGFAEKMNQKAKALGMKNTGFVTPSGLDAEGHYTTAYDMALLAAAAMENPIFAEVVGTKQYRASYKDAEGNAQKRTYSNHNRLLHSLEGAEGIKTGFTKKSGRCLVSSCKRNDMRLIAVTLRAPDDWNDHKALYDRGFAKYSSYTLGGEFLIKPLLIAGGTKTSVPVSGGSLKASLMPEDLPKISYQLHLPRFLYAPVKAGDKVGEAHFLLNGNLIGKADFCATESSEAVPVKEESFWDILRQNINKLLCIK